MQYTFKHRKQGTEQGNKVEREGNDGGKVQMMQVRRTSYCTTLSTHTQGLKGGTNPILWAFIPLYATRLKPISHYLLMS